MKAVFVDTNIFIYASGDSHPHKNPSQHILERIARGQIKAVTNTEVLQEILYRYWAVKDRNRALLVFDACVKIVPIILPVTRQDVLKAREVLGQYPSIEPRDAVHAGVMLNRGIKTIYSYDKHYDQIEGIRRVEP